MRAQRWQQINELFQSASERGAEERASFIDEACHDDQDLHREIKTLIASYERAESFIELPAFEVAPELLANPGAGPLIGELVGHYRVESLIGIGGMGEVYLARDEILGRKVALKFLPEDLTADETQLSRFKSEARTASALNHPNILTVHEIGVDDNRHFIATEFIEGETLRALLARGKLDLRRALDIALQVGSALSAAHKSGFLHRDIKPENIMLRPDAYVKVLDFGIAKLSEQEAAIQGRARINATTFETQYGLIFGTARYMSPEQARAEVVDARTDIWSFGVLLYEMLAGHPPFEGVAARDCITAVLESEPSPLTMERPQVPLRLEEIVRKALRKDKKERYQAVEEMLDDLRALKHDLEAEGSSWSRFSRVKLSALGAAILALAAFTSYSFYFATPRQLSDHKSIAVLPFADLSQAGDQEHLCDGIQEEILSRLSKIRDLKVISRTSTERFQSAPKDLPKIAEQLGVAHVLEGTVQKAGDRVRVSVQLINAQKDSHLWAEQYDRKLTDLFALESEIAKTIADTLQAKLTGSEQRAIADRPTENPEAHQLFLKGTYFSNKRTGPDFRTAIQYFQEAVSKDPNFARAYAGMAEAYTILSVLGGEGPTVTASKAKAAAEKALQLDESLPEAHKSLGLVLAYYEFDFARSRKEFERAIELDPNYADAHHQLGNANLTKVGEFDRAIAEGIRAVELDPLSLIINSDLGQNYLMARRYEEAIEQSRKTLELDPRFYCARWNLGEALQMKGDLGGAIAEYEKTVELTDDPTALAMLAQGYAKHGQTDKARNLLAQLEQISTQRYVGSVSFAFVHLALGENEKALEEIERACREPADPDIINLKIEPLLDPLRGHPRFERLVAEVIGAGAAKSGQSD